MIRMIGMPVARQRFVVIQFAEAAAELDVLFAADVLIAQQQDTVIKKDAMNFAEGAFAHRF